MNKIVEVQDLGHNDYKATWDYQEGLFKSVIDTKIKNRREETNLETQNYFLFVEHPHVYTLGKSGDFSHLLLNEEQLTQKGATFYRINRGGDITYHGPGQIVGYPILDLENFFTDIHKYLRFLEEMIILTLMEYGLKAERSPGETGVWLGVGTPFARKICAMGVRASRWVTSKRWLLFSLLQTSPRFTKRWPTALIGVIHGPIGTKAAPSLLTKASTPANVTPKFSGMNRRNGG